MFAKDKVSQSMIDAVNKVLATESKKEEPQQLDEAFPTVADAQKRASQPKPSGGSGIKLGTRYGGGKQADEPESDEDESKPARGKYGAHKTRRTDTKLYKEEDDECVDKPEAKKIAKKEVGKHEKDMHKEESSFISRLIQSLNEREMTPSETKKKEEIAKAMKRTPDDIAAMKKRYGSRWKEVLYATATKRAMKEEKEEDEGHEDEKEDKALVKKMVKKDALKEDQIDEKLDYSVRTTDTLAGRIPGGKDNEHSSSKVKLEGDVEESGLRNKAHASAAAGKKSFEFLGKTLPVTVKKEEVELDESHKVGDSVIVNSKFFGKQKGKVVKVDKQSVHVQRNDKKHSEKYPHDSVMKEDVEQIDELKKSTVGSYIQKKFQKMSDEPASKNPGEIFAKKDAKGIQRAGLRISGIKATQKEETEPKKLKSFSSMKKEMLGKAGATSEEKHED